MHNTTPHDTPTTTGHRHNATESAKSDHTPRPGDLTYKREVPGSTPGPPIQPRPSIHADFASRDHLRIPRSLAQGTSKSQAVGAIEGRKR